MAMDVGEEVEFSVVVSFRFPTDEEFVGEDAEGEDVSNWRDASRRDGFGSEVAAERKALRSALSNSVRDR